MLDHVLASKDAADRERQEMAARAEELESALEEEKRAGTRGGGGARVAALEADAPRRQPPARSPLARPRGGTLPERRDISVSTRAAPPAIQ
ncbi:MAG: hypothetical protein R3B70_36495 [Polyangiaceae bacterium]